MEGWRRSFVALCVLATTAYMLIWWNSKPQEKWANSVYECSLRESDLSPERARAYLALGHIPAQDNYLHPSAPISLSGICRAAVQSVANGTRYSERLAEWRREAMSNTRWLVGFLLAVYVIGRGIGWIWRGFFPKKAP